MFTDSLGQLFAAFGAQFFGIVEADNSSLGIENYDAATTGPNSEPRPASSSPAMRCQPHWRASVHSAMNTVDRIRARILAQGFIRLRLQEKFVRDFHFPLFEHWGCAIRMGSEKTNLYPNICVLPVIPRPDPPMRGHRDPERR